MHHAPKPVGGCFAFCPICNKERDSQDDSDSQIQELWKEIKDIKYEISNLKVIIERNNKK